MSVNKKKTTQIFLKLGDNSWELKALRHENNQLKQVIREQGEKL